MQTIEKLLTYPEVTDAEVEELLQKASEFLDRIIDKIEVAHHDMGFLYSPSCVAAYKLTGNEDAKSTAVLAAENLITRNILRFLNSPQISF